MRIRFVALFPFLSMGVALSGCAGAAAAVKTHAATEMKCDEAKLSLKQPNADSNLFIVDGCGETGRYYTNCNVFGLCGTVFGEIVSTLVRKQAAFDFHCDEPAIALQSLNADTYGARGCNKQASYLLVCQGGGCKAVQNTQAQGN